MSLYELHDFNSFRIETNVAVPERESNSSRMRALLENMEYGQSVLLPISLINVAKLVTAAKEDKYIIREYKDKNGAVNEFRVWKFESSKKPNFVMFEEEQ